MLQSGKRINLGFKIVQGTW